MDRVRLEVLKEAAVALAWPIESFPVKVVGTQTRPFYVFARNAAQAGDWMRQHRLKPGVNAKYISGHEQLLGHRIDRDQLVLLDRWMDNKNYPPYLDSELVHHYLRRT